MIAACAAGAKSSVQWLIDGAGADVNVMAHKILIDRGKAHWGLVCFQLRTQQTDPNARKPS
jgi:hypothetical protein